ncbi:haloacid dehalogenase-like hydrolase [Drepanopeziza brunnea f. sp. 'multigermtubi' MB_m1]|uniref:Haloacid dehalogenase-like hydrolase n=1 Tax=Marssonina brunnea f. sp. multigermtubi (strain MB_m1) TaxID=1072389 RepID=K1WEA8_MARBU|nr:haloacid dehalogenase-like hydrolase [Drepanopeziza brunnea f. sp. 'multigermtubi' MB_m1]EKD15745.1 haloacid dehalogenase-like hydrolase [Drepanopeziza brunnea f. sp. 'multigermtubi' MB_m1]
MSSTSHSFSAPPTRTFFKGGLLFDIIGKEIGVDPAVILETSHGRRSIDTLKVLSPERANWEYIKHMEGLLPKMYGDDAVEIPGARDLLAQIKQASVPWAIVTSGTTPLVTGWLGVLNLPVPENLVVAEDVENGKPDPACYLMGMKKLGATDPSQVLVLEDSPAGILAGRAAGCKVLGLVTSHTVEQVVAAKPDWIVRDLKSVKVVNFSEDGVQLEFRDALMAN